MKWIGNRIFLCLAVLATTSSVVLCAEELSSIGGVHLDIAEQAGDGNYKITPGLAITPVDSWSRIVLSFDTSQLQQPPNADQWQALQGVLEEIKELTSQRATVIASLNNARGADSAKITEAQKLAANYAKLFMDFKGRVKKIVGDRTYQQIDAEATRRAVAGQPGGFLQSLADWASKSMATLTPDPTALTAQKSTATIQITAFLEPSGQDRKPVHVENYDQLPEGILNPLPKTGLQMSSVEQAQLNQELEYAHQAAAAITEIQKQKGALISQVMAMKVQLQAKIQQAVATADQQVQQMQGRIAAIKTTLGSEDRLSAFIATSPAFSSAQATAAQLSMTVEGLKTQLNGLNGLRTWDLTSGGTDASASSLATLVNLLGNLQQEISSLPAQVASASAQTEQSIKAMTIDEQASVTQQVNGLKQDITNDASGALGQLKETLPLTTQLVKSWSTMLKDAKDQAGAANTLAQNQVPTIQHSLNNLPPGTIDLRRSGVKNGDFMTVKVQVNDGTGRSLERKSYAFRVDSMGLHRQYTGQLLFASPTTGVNKNQFQANAGVLATWKYSYRNPVGAQKIISWLDPGLGIHATSLHQGTSTVEVGAGLGLSLWGDLVTAGYGWNLGVSKDRGYFFVGIGILDLLHKMEQIRVPNQK